MAAKALSITAIEQTWDNYKNDDSYTGLGKLNLAAWMGEKMGLVLAEVHRLQEQLEPGTATVLVRDGEFSEVMDLPPGWDYRVVEEWICHSTE